MELLNKIQQQLKVPKTHQKPGIPYKYRSCEDILEAVKPLLGDKGTLTLSDEIVAVGNRFYVKARAELRQIVAAGEDIASAIAFAREAETKPGTDEAKLTGAASSYARKYALNGLFCIDDTKDADDEPDAPQQAGAPKPAVEKKSVIQEVQERTQRRKTEIFALCNKLSPTPLLDKKDYEQFVKSQTGLSLSVDNYPDIITRLEQLTNQ